MSEKQRPVFLDLTKMRFPPMAIVSIGHRVTGVLIFLFLPLMLYFLHQAILSPKHFARLTDCLHSGWVRFVIWIMLSVIWYHIIAGIRHLVMDCGIGESVKAGRFSAYLIFVLAIVMSSLMGVWLW